MWLAMFSFFLVQVPSQRKAGHKNEWKKQMDSSIHALLGKCTNLPLLLLYTDCCHPWLAENPNNSCILFDEAGAQLINFYLAPSIFSFEGPPLKRIVTSLSITG